MQNTDLNLQEGILEEEGQRSVGNRTGNHPSITEDHDDVDNSNTPENLLEPTYDENMGTNESIDQKDWWCKVLLTFNFCRWSHGRTWIELINNLYFIILMQT